MQNFDLRVVLVRPIYERNVGSVSRAMANMGASKLILIDPKCEFTIEAQKAAATAQTALQNKIIYASWEEFYEKEPRGLQIATSARDGRGRQSQDLNKVLKKLKKTSPLLKENLKKSPVIHVVFGPEDWGLSAADLENAHYCCYIPTFGHASLNLAQAVLLALYIFRSVFGGEKTKLDGQQKPKELQKKSPYIFPDKSLKNWLKEMNIDLSKKKINVYTVLKRMILQNTPSEKEFRILEMALQQSTRKMQSAKKSAD